MQKRLLFLLTLFVSLSSWAEVPDFMLTLSKTDEKCLGNGTIIATATGARTGGILSFALYKKATPNTVETFATGKPVPAGGTLTHTFISLRAGEYIVKAALEIGGEKREKVANITILNQVENLEFTLEEHRIDCGVNKVVATVTKGHPKTYELLDEGGSVLVGPQASNEITLPSTLMGGKVYTVRVTDECNDKDTKNFTKKFDKTLKLQSNINEYVDFNRFAVQDCNTMAFPIKVFNKNINDGLDALEPYQYPVRIEVTLKRYSDFDRKNLEHTETQNLILENEDELVKPTFNYIDNMFYNLDIKATDRCGKTDAFEQAGYVGPVVYFYTSDLETQCGESLYWYIDYNSFHNSDYKVEILEHPTEYDPAVDGFVNNERTFPGTQKIYHLNSRNGSPNDVPAGKYKLRFTYCGDRVEEVTRIYKKTDYYLGFEQKRYGRGAEKQVYYDCTMTHAYPNFQVTSNATHPKFVSVKITEAPQSFIDEYGALPYDLTRYIRADDQNRRLDLGEQNFPGLPFGTYKIKANLTSDCKDNVVEAQFTFNPVLTENFTVEKHCTQAHIKYDVQANDFYNLHSYTLEKYVEEEGKWTKHNNMPPYRHWHFIDYTKRSNFDFTLDGVIFNLPEVSKKGSITVDYPAKPTRYRLISQQEMDFINGYTKYCTRVIKEFVLGNNPISIKNFYVFSCTDGSRVLVVQAEGAVPLKYKIIAVNGSPTTAFAETESAVFYGLQPALYTVRVTDGCGNVRNFEINTRDARLPRIIPKNICVGQNGSLIVEGLPFLKLEWFKNNVPLNKQGGKIDFTPFTNADKGVYTVTIKNTNPSAPCPNETLTLDVTQADTGTRPNVGMGQTVTYPSQNKVINLFDHLTGPYVTYGDWIDMNGTGNLIANYLDLNGLPKGTYRFKYKATGFCDVSNETIVTLNIANNYWYGTESSIWDVANNWTANTVPPKGSDIEFATDANNTDNPVSSKRGKAKRDLHVPTGIANKKDIRNLINNSTVNLIVPADASLTINGRVTGSSRAEDVNKIQILAKKDKPNGSVIFKGQDCNSTLYGTVHLYAKGYQGAEQTWRDDIPGSPTFNIEFKSSYYWQHFGVPVESIVADPNFYGSYLREYDETFNGKTPNQYYQKWRDLKNTSVLTAFKGYEITQKTPKTYVLQGKFQFCDKNIVLTRRAVRVQNSTNPNDANNHYGLGQNIFGNSYTSSINVNKMTFPPEVEATAYLYNTGRFYDWTTHQNQTNDGVQVVAGQYTAIPKNPSAIIFDGRIPSMNGFLLRFTPDQTKFGRPDATVNIKYGDGGVQPNTKPQTVAPAGSGSYIRSVADDELYFTEASSSADLAPESTADDLSYLDIVMSSKSTLDRVVLIEQEGTGDEFDNGWDGRKFFGTPTAFIYSETADGPMQVNTTSKLNGQTLTFYANNDKDYTLYLNRKHLKGYEDLKLLDLETKKAVPLTAEQTTYSFKSSKNNKASRRFKIVNASKVSNDMFNEMLLTADYNNGKISVQNFTGKKGLVELYDISGRLLISETLPVGMHYYPVSVADGVYVLRVTAKGKEDKKKIVVKNK